MSIEKYVSQLSDELLENCFLEIMYTRENIPFSTQINQLLLDRYKSDNNLDIFPGHLLIDAILYEIAKRKYREDGICV